MAATLPDTAFCSVVMNAGTAVPAGGGGSVGPLGGAGGAGACGAAAGLPAVAAPAAEAGFAVWLAEAPGGIAGAEAAPVAELVSLVVAVCAAVGFSGFGAGAAAGGATGAADAPAPGASVRETSPFSGSAGVVPAGLSAAASGGVGVSDGLESSAIASHESAINPQSAIRNPQCLGPLERAFLPGVVVTDDEDEDEHDHFDQPEQRELVEDDGPRKHEHGLHVEDDEQHRDEVVANAVAIARVGQRLDAALVRLELHLVVLRRVQHAREHDREDRETRRNDDEKGDWDVRRRHRDGDRPRKTRAVARKADRFIPYADALTQFPATHRNQTSLRRSELDAPENRDLY